jgi:monofunctional glycosyltransferase
MLRWLARLYLLGVLLGTPLSVGWAWARSPALGVALLALLGPQWLAGVIVLALRWLNPPTTAFMLNVWRERRRAGLGPDLEYAWVPAAAHGPVLQLAAIAAEDAYFALHAGFDWESLRAAYAYNRAAAPGRKSRGGSTISQQLAKNLFLWQRQSYVRKGLEAYLTLLLEAAWPKRRILEMYLNVAQFGPHTFGAQAAAQRFFNKPALALTRSEAALLMTALPNPRGRRVEQPAREMRFRQLLILGSMQKLPADYLARLGLEPARSPA